ncbi:MAG: hypothetical protein IJH64_01175 [Oscillospiraceae bacterium]|nr:hypothetical protein [Oscillospiraceae bacterium]
MKVNKTGIRSVDDLHGVAFTGNIIPHSWYKAIRMEDGKPDFTAITILGEILYWHRPREECGDDESEGVTLRKKFKADLLQLSYSQLESKFGLSKDMSRRAIENLEELGLVKRNFRTITTDGGMKLGNVMYLELFTQKLLEITFPDGEEDPCGFEPTRVSAQTDKVIGLNTIACGLEPMTNTEITTNNTTIDYTSVYQQEKERVRDQIEYEYLITDRKTDRGMIDDMVDLITDVNISGKKFQTVNGESMPADIVREHLARIDMEIMRQVLDNIRSVTKPVTNLRGYLLTTLYNAPVTYETGLDMQVRQDMNRREVSSWRN